jgi:glyoxylase-like metal-dependent hydrolase (beta-lactamase superfamily II)
MAGGRVAALVRTTAKTLLALLGVGALVLAVALAEAHVEIRSIHPELPDAEALLALTDVPDAPRRIAWLNTASQSGGAPATLAHPAFLLAWADGRRFAVDLGMEREQALAFGRLTALAFGSDPIVPHGAVWQQLGAETGRIRGVAFTHLHNDHTGGLPGLCRALGRPLDLFQTPWQADLGNFSTRPGRAHLEAAGCTEVRRLPARPLAAIPGFPGLAVVPGAGHTPGSSVFAARVDGLTWLLAGDVTNFRINLDEDRPKPWIYSWFVVPESRERLAGLRRWLRELDARPDFRAVVSHDLEALERSGMPAFAPPGREAQPQP